MTQNSNIPNESIQKLISILAFPENYAHDKIVAAKDELTGLKIDEKTIEDLIQKMKDREHEWEYEQQWDFDQALSGSANSTISPFYWYSLMLLPLYCIILTVMATVIYYNGYETYALDSEEMFSTIASFLILTIVYVIALFGFVAKKYWAWTILFVNAFTCVVGGLVNILMPEITQTNATDPLTDLMNHPIYNLIYLLLGIWSLLLLLKPVFLKLFVITQKRKNIAWAISIAFGALSLAGPLFE